MGIGFAVPSNMAKQVMDQIMKNGKVSRGYMGVTLETLTPDLAQQFHVKGDHGAIVGDVTPNAPGAKAGLQSGDVITAIDGKKVDGPDDLTLDVISHAPGSTVSLDIIRNGEPMKVNVTLGQRPGGIDWNQTNRGGNDNNDNNDNSGNQGNVSARGINVEPLTPDLAQQIGAPAGIRGVVITSVDADSSAADNVARGMVITAVDRHPVSNVQDFKRLMSEAQGRPVLLTYNLDGQTGFTVVQPK